MAMSSGCAPAGVLPGAASNAEMLPDVISAYADGCCGSTGTIITDSTSERSTAIPFRIAVTDFLRMLSTVITFLATNALVVLSAPPRHPPLSKSVASPPSNIKELQSNYLHQSGGAARRIRRLPSVGVLSPTGKAAEIARSSLMLPPMRTTIRNGPIPPA